MDVMLNDPIALVKRLRATNCLTPEELSNLDGVQLTVEKGSRSTIYMRVSKAPSIVKAVLIDGKWFRTE